MKHCVENVSMKKCTRQLSCLLILLHTSILTAQDLPMEAWRTHFSYNTVEQITYGNNKLFCTTENSLFYVDLDDESINIFTKLDGLSDANPTAFEYSENEKALVIGYESGLVDIIQNGEITTITDIKNSSLVGDKIINDITIYDGTVYLGTGYGVLILPLSTKELTENYRSIGKESEDLEVLELLVANDYLYAITDKGVQYGALEKNLLDFNNWTIIYAEDFEFNNLTKTSEQPYVVVDETQIVTFENDTLALLSTDNNDPILDLLWQDDNLYALKENAVQMLDGSSFNTVLSLDYPATTFYYHDGFWIGTESQGLFSPSKTLLCPNGPLSDDISRIRFMDNQLFALYGPNVEDYSGNSDGLGYSYFNNTQWQNENIDGFYNLTDVALYQDQLYFSSAGYGVYNQSGQSLLSGLPSDAIIPELAIFKLLYIPVYNATQALWVLDADNNLNSYSSTYINTSEPLGIDISQGETVWIRRSSSSGSGISVFNIDSDDYRLVNSSDNLPSSSINEVAVDLSDQAWVATSAGVGVFSSATYAFDDYEAQIPIYDNEVLFEDENISAIAVDGGDRIWMGTDDGLWIFDNDIDEQEYHFTIDNSILPSNDIEQLAYNPDNGEMFIQTSKGLVSYRSSSSLSTSGYSNVKIFPNPVRPGYDGLVGITGLAQDVSVKITDVNGKLMREVQANGGTASWDLLDYNQRKVVSGIYVIFCSSDDGEETYIGKIAVVR